MGMEIKDVVREAIKIHDVMKGERNLIQMFNYRNARRW
jgi:hypothetical protein